MIYVFVINKISNNSNIDLKNIENNTMHNMQELLLHFVELILIFSLHSSINLYTNLFLHLQFLQSKYSPISHDSKYILYCIYLYQLILQIHIDIYHYSSVVYYYKHLHLIYIYTYMFYAILYALFHQFLLICNYCLLDMCVHIYHIILFFFIKYL